VYPIACRYPDCNDAARLAKYSIHKLLGKVSQLYARPSDTPTGPARRFLCIISETQEITGPKYWQRVILQLLDRLDGAGDPQILPRRQ
jgi:hypothetical protein